MYEITCCTWHHDPLNSLDGTPLGLGTRKMDYCIVCCTEYLCTSLCLAPEEEGQACSTLGTWPNVFSFGWGIGRDLTKLKIQRVGIFDNVTKEPGSYNHHQIDFFTDMAAILNLLDLRSIMGCPGAMSSIRYTRSVFTRTFRANFWLSSPRKKIVMGKKDRCAVFGYTVEPR